MVLQHCINCCRFIFFLEEEHKKGMSQSVEKNMLILEGQVKELEKKNLEAKQLYQSQVCRLKFGIIFC